MPVIQKPKDETVPPTVLPEDDKDRPIDSKPVPIDEDVVTPPKPVPQPVPVSPIYEQPQENKTVDFSFYGTACKVRYNDKAKFTLDGSDNEQLAEAWNNLSTNACNNTIRDCLELRIRLQLSDWAYPNMLDSFVRKVFGDTNEATLFMAYIYCQSGYKMRLALADGRLCMLIAGKHAIYDTGYFNIDGEGDTANKRPKKGMQDLMFEIMTILWGLSLGSSSSNWFKRLEFLNVVKRDFSQSACKVTKHCRKSIAFFCFYAKTGWFCGAFV